MYLEHTQPLEAACRVTYEVRRCPAHDQRRSASGAPAHRTFRRFVRLLNEPSIASNLGDDFTSGNHILGRSPIVPIRPISFRTPGLLKFHGW